MTDETEEAKCPLSGADWAGLTAWNRVWWASHVQNILVIVNQQEQLQNNILQPID